MVILRWHHIQIKHCFVKTNNSVSYYVFTKERTVPLTFFSHIRLIADYRPETYSKQENLHFYMFTVFDNSIVALICTLSCANSNIP